MGRAIQKGYATAEVPSHESKRAGGRMKSHALIDGYHILAATLKEGMRYRFGRMFRSRKAASAM